MTDRSNWFEEFFHGVTIDLWRKFSRPELTRADADFLERILGRKKRLLDIPCGSGRHSLELARRGCRMTGVDLSAGVITEAKTEAKSAKLKAEFILGDMRRLRWQSEFDGACCMGNSFGYMEYPDMQKFVRGLARALKPGARFVIETGCTAESILPNLKERVWYQVDDILFAIENRYLADISCLETEATFVRGGQTEVRKWWHWVYTIGEIRRLLEQAALTVRDVHGSHDGRPYKLGSQIAYLVAEKPAPARSRKPIVNRKS